MNTRRRSPAGELAAATSALVQPYDITDIVAGMLEHARAALEAEAVALLVLHPGGDLELLGSTSHAASELEIYQAQTQEGPCIDCLRSLRPVAAHGKADLLARWPTVGPVMVDSGYLSVHAQPLLWHGRALGGLNAFFHSDSRLPEDSQALAQSFGDIATLALVQTQQPSDRELTAHIRQALDGRTLVEQAKGVLMQTRELDPAEAYTTLRTQAIEQGLTLTEMARNMVWRAHAQ